MVVFQDRLDAGRRLAEHLPAYQGRSDVLVLGLPRGGVPVAYEVARALDAPLDVFLVRKLGVPGYEELAMGAVASGGVVVLNEALVSSLRLPSELIAQILEREQRELDRREKLYRGDRPARSLREQTVVLVDDGLATGASMRAAVAAVRKHSPERVVVGVPVAPADACAELREEADEVTCIETPEPFYAVGLWYADFSQTSDDEVRDLLERAERPLRRVA